MKAFLCAILVACAMLAIPASSDAHDGGLRTVRLRDGRVAVVDRRGNIVRVERDRFRNDFRRNNDFDRRDFDRRDLERDQLRRELARRDLDRRLRNSDLRFRAGNGFGGNTTVIRERVGPFGILGSRTTVISN